MPFPSETFIGMFPSGLQMVGDELRAQGSQLTGYLAKEHHDDGTHSVVTADSVISARFVVPRTQDFPLTEGYTFDANDDQRMGTYAHRDAYSGTRELEVVSESTALETRVTLTASRNNRDDLAEVTLNTSNPDFSVVIRRAGASPSTSLTLLPTTFTVLWADIVTNRAYFERGRTVAVGEWTAVPYNAGNFTASAGTWTVDSGDQLAYAYTLVGKTMTLAFDIVGTDVSAGAILRIAIPGGYTAARRTRTPISVRDNGTYGTGFAIVKPSQAYVECVASQAAANFAITAGDNTDVNGEITFEVQ